MSAIITIIEVLIVLYLGYLCAMKLIPKVFTVIMAKFGFTVSPLTTKRIKRFKTIKRGYYSFIIIVTLLFLSLFLELMVNNKALVVNYNGITKFPAVAEWVHNVFFVKNMSFFNKRSDFGQIGESEVDYRLLQKYSQNPELLKDEIELRKIESKGQDKEIPILEQAYQNFKTKPNFIMMPIYPYSPYEHLLEQISMRVTPESLKNMASNNLEKDLIKSVESLTYFEITKKTIDDLNKESFNEDVIKSLNPLIGKQFKDLASMEQALDSLNLTPEQKEFVEKYVEGRSFDKMDLMKEFRQLNISYEKIVEIFKCITLIPSRPPNSPSLLHPLGTDDSGLDVIPQLLYGFRISLMFALVVTLVGNCIGVTVGAVMGYYGGWVDILTQRFIEIWASIPFLFTIMIIASIVQPSFMLLAIMLIVLSSWLGITYTIRGEFYREKSKDYVLAAESIGVSNTKIMLKHILPNALVPLVTYVPFEIVAYISSLVSLDYLGFGLPPGTPSWGGLLSQGMQHIRYFPHLIIVPSVTFALTLFAVVMIGEAVREAFDPKVFSRLR